MFIYLVSYQSLYQTFTEFMYLMMILFGTCN